MGWGVTFIVIGLATLCLLWWYFFGKLSINKSYLKKNLEKIFNNTTFNTSDIVSKEFEVGELQGENATKDKVYYHIVAKDSEGVSHELEARLFNPAAEFEEEEYKQSREQARPKDNSHNPSMNNMGGSHVSGVEAAQSMLRDQARLEEEERVIKARSQKIKLDIEIAKRINQVSELIPHIYYFDEKRQCLFVEYAGQDSLKNVLINQKHANKMDLLENIIIGVADIHKAISNFSLLLPQRKPMNAEDFRNLLRIGFDQMEKAKILTKEQISDLLNDYYPVASWLGENYISNIRLRGLSPYDIYVQGQKPVLRDIEGLDVGPAMTNIAELLKDPVTDLSIDEEEKLIKIYHERCYGNDDYAQTLKLYHLASCHLLTVQLCYMHIYLKRTQELGSPIKVLDNWDKQHFDTLFNNAVTKWEQYEESKAYAKKIREIFNFKTERSLSS